MMDIRADRNYHGQRIILSAHLGQIPIHMRFDVGFGDTVIPKPSVVDFPTLLDFPPPGIRAYPKESVISEKLQILVELVMANNRMKDYYDLYVLAKNFEFQGTSLIKAIKSTFKRRDTEFPLNKPMAMSDDFIKDESKQAQWSAFIRVNNAHQILDSLSEIVSLLSNFLFPALKAAAINTNKWEYSWKSGGPWIKTDKI